MLAAGGAQGPQSDPLCPRLLPTGLCALSINNDNCYLAYPGSATIGEVQVFDTINLVRLLGSGAMPLLPQARVGASSLLVLWLSGSIPNAASWWPSGLARSASSCTPVPPPCAEQLAACMLEGTKEATEPLWGRYFTFSFKAPSGISMPIPQPLVNRVDLASVSAMQGFP